MCACKGFESPDWSALLASGSPFFQDPLAAVALLCSSLGAVPKLNQSLQPALIYFQSILLTFLQYEHSISSLKDVIKNCILKLTIV